MIDLGSSGDGRLAPACLAALFTGLPMIAWSCFGYLRLREYQRQRTLRLRIALDGVPPESRPEIIKSCSDLEGSGLPSERAGIARSTPTRHSESLPTGPFSSLSPRLEHTLE